MNSDNIYPVTVSLFMLREIKRRQMLVNHGYQLLKRKSEAIRIKGRQVTKELVETQAILGHTLKEAYISLAAIKFTNGESNALVLENIGQAQVRVERVLDNISGVATVSLQAVEETGAGDALRYAGLGGGGQRTTEAKRAFREAVRILLKFASLRNSCILLDQAIRSTLRKVNGIEKVIMPKLKNTERYILMEMDEREREEYHRMKMVKAKKVRAQKLEYMRLQNLYVESGVTNESACCRQTSRIRSFECLTSLLYSNISNSPFTPPLLESCDFKPICYPHSWDDDDLLF